MEMQMYTKNNFHIIKMNEVLNLSSNITELEDIILQLISGGKNHIAVHFADSSYLCSKTAAVIIRCWETIKDNNGVLAFVNVNNDILDFLTIIDLDSQIPIYRSADDIKAS